MRFSRDQIIEYRSSDTYGRQFRSRLCPTAEAVRVPLLSPSLDLRAETAEDFERVITGHASVSASPYLMRDYFGEYEETISPGAFAVSLSRSPEVVHRIQHEGLGVASTRSGTLSLQEDKVGLLFRSVVDIRETDASDLVRKLERGIVSHTSFAFRMVDYEWDSGYETLTIREVDLDGGDVASVAYGANPAGSHQVLPPEVAGLTEEAAEPPTESEPSPAETRATWEAEMLGNVALITYARE